MFDKLKGAAYISTFDLQHGFWQAALDPKTAHRTAFTCEYGTFQYKQSAADGIAIKRSILPIFRGNETR